MKYKTGLKWVNIEIILVFEIFNIVPVGNYMFKVNTSVRCEVCSK